MQKNSRWLLGSLFVLAACGKDKIGVTTAGATFSTSVAADALVDVSDAIADDSSTSSSREFAETSLAVVPDDYTAQGVTVSRSCTQPTSINSVSVNVEFTGSETKSITLPRMGVETVATASGSLGRVWTAQTGVTLACNGAATHVQLNWANDTVVNGLSVTQTGTRGRNATRTITLSSGLTRTKRNVFTAYGTRSVSWATGDGVSGVTVSRTKTISSNVTRQGTVTDRDGSDQTFTTNVKTATGAPLVVNVVRSSSAPYTLKSKTVKSGTVVATRSGNDRIEFAFADVVYDLTSSTPCLPASGAVTVNYYSPDTATDATSTYTVTFGASTDSGVSITESGGSAVNFEEYAPSGCDLEKEI